MSRPLSNARAVNELGPDPAIPNHLFLLIRVSSGGAARGGLGTDLVNGTAVDQPAARCQSHDFAEKYWSRPWVSQRPTPLTNFAPRPPPPNILYCRIGEPHEMSLACDVRFAHPKTVFRAPVFAPGPPLASPLPQEYAYLGGPGVGVATCGGNHTAHSVSGLQAATV